MLKGEFTLSIIFPLIIIVIVPEIAIKKPTAAAVPIDFRMSYPNVLINGTINEPPPIPRGTEIKPPPIPNKPAKKPTAVAANIINNKKYQYSLIRCAKDRKTLQIMLY